MNGSKWRKGEIDRSTEREAKKGNKKTKGINKKAKEQE
jgi:hypothetical protein